MVNVSFKYEEYHVIDAGQSYKEWLLGRKKKKELNKNDFSDST